MQRLTWEDYFKEIVQVTARRACCKRLHVGCLFVMNNRIIAQGYNGFLPGCPHVSIMRDGHEQATIHAEQNVIADCAKRGISCNGCTAYITHFPCLTCMKMMIAVGVKEVKYVNNYNNDETVYYFANMSEVKLKKME